MYSSGYGNYNNPYYSSGYASSGDYYDYSQPITVINQQPNQSALTSGATDDTAQTSPEIQEGTARMDAARDLFKAGDYTGAMREIDLAIKSLPKDAALHEFRALVFFATKDYKQAAATLYAVLSAGPGWDWTTLSGMYASTATYSDQLRALEQYVRTNPDAPDGHFVLAYHYLTCGHNEAAQKQYREVLRIQPSDQLASQLLTLAGGDPNTNSSAASASSDEPKPESEDPAATSEAPKDIDASKLIGKWSAKRPDGTTFSLNITPDKKFTWSYTRGSKKEEFGGTYAVDGAILVLTRTDGSQMPGLITLSDSGFNFKLYGGAPDDPGLDFRQ